MKRRFFEILDMIEMGSYEIAALQHLPWDFRIAAFVRLQKGEPAKENHEEKAEHKGENDHIPEGAAFFM